MYSPLTYLYFISQLKTKCYLITYLILILDRINYPIFFLYFYFSQFFCNTNMGQNKLSHIFAIFFSQIFLPSKIPSSFFLYNYPQRKPFQMLDMS